MYIILAKKYWSSGEACNGFSTIGKHDNQRGNAGALCTVCSGDQRLNTRDKDE